MIQKIAEKQPKSNNSVSCIGPVFVVALKSTPLFNRKEIGESFLNYDSVHLIREIEMVLLPGSVLQIIKREGNICEVTTDEYPSEKQLYIDQRFVTECIEIPKSRKKEMPTQKKMLENLYHFPKVPYIWGGNVSKGVPELLDFYPPQKTLSPFDYMYWQLKGVDCSGLLYEITNGCTPRNTHQILTTYPEVSTPKPLDVVVWPGHMFIVLPGYQTIESRIYDGIVFSNLTKRLKEVEHFNPKFVRFC